MNGGVCCAARNHILSPWELKVEQSSLRLPSSELNEEEGVRRNRVARCQGLQIKTQDTQLNLNFR